jgi:YesN/AraC family two-component response regulator
MHVKRAKETDYLDYLTKPIEFEDLKKSLEENFDV